MRSNGIFWAVLLILAGLLLLAGNLGLFDRLSIDVWNLLWPLFLIALGTWFIIGTLVGPSHIAVEDAAIPLDGAARACIEVHHGAGTLIVAAGAATGQLVEGSFGGGLDRLVRLRDDTLEAKLRLPSAMGFVFPWNWAQGGLAWNLRLNNTVALELDLETGASRSELDLSELNVTELKLETVAGSTSITLPASAGYTRVKVEAGAASVSLQVPGGVAARIKTESGLARINIDETRFPSTSGNRHESPDYGSASNKVDIDIETGVGTVNII